MNDPSKNGRALKPFRHDFVAVFGHWHWPWLRVGLRRARLGRLLGLGRVENASLLSWCVALALVHSFTVYRKRGAFKRWSIMCACITFAFVITGTFITRSGIVQSVHAFEGDPVSLVLFGGLIAVSILVGVIGLFIRWKSFCPGENDVMESFVSRDAAYYFNNVIMIVFTVILCYLTVASALPSWLPFGGQSLSAGTYNAIARPLGVVYCAIIAVCPLLSWVKTDPKTFWKKARIPALCAVVLFVGLMSYFATTLYPAYDAIIQAGGTEAEELASEGPVWYYNGIAVVASPWRACCSSTRCSSLAARLARVQRHGQKLGGGVFRERRGRRPAFRRLHHAPLDVHYFGGSHWLVDVCDREGRLCRFRPRCQHGWHVHD